MPFLSLVHLRELRCPECAELVAPSGARSVVVGTDGFPVAFPDDDPPAEMHVHLPCRCGHEVELFVPNEISAEQSLATPDEAPLAPDAQLLEGTSESGAPLKNF